MKVRTCDSNGEWLPIDESHCLKRFAGANEAFIDMSYRIMNCTLDLFEYSIRRDIETMLVRELMIKKASIHQYLPRVCGVSTEEASVCVNIRIIPHYLVSSFVMIQLNELHQNLTGNFYEEVSEETPSYLSLMVLRQRPSVTAVIALTSVSLLVLILLILIIAYFKVNSKGRGGNIRRLRKPSSRLPKQNKDALLN